MFEVSNSGNTSTTQKTTDILINNFVNAAINIQDSKQRSRSMIRGSTVKSDHDKQYIATIEVVVGQFAEDNYESRLNELLTRSKTKGSYEGATSQEQYQIAIVKAISGSDLETSLKIKALTAFKSDSRTNPSEHSQTKSRDECDKEIGRLKVAEYDKGLSGNVERERELAAKTHELEQQLKQANETLAAEKQQLQQELTDQKATLETQITAKTHELETAKQQAELQEKALIDQKATLETQITAKTHELEQQLKQALEEKDKALADQKTQLDTQLKEADGKLQKELAEQKITLERQLQQQLKTAENQKTQLVSQTQELNNKLVAQVKEAEEKLRQAELKTKEAEGKLTDKDKELQQQLKTAENQNQLLQTQMQTLTQSDQQETKAQLDLEDIVIEENERQVLLNKIKNLEDLIEKKAQKYNDSDEISTQGSDEDRGNSKQESPLDDIENTTKENMDATNALLTNVGMFLSAKDDERKKMTDIVNNSLTALPTMERDGIIGGFRKAASAFEKGVDFKSGLKWGAGIGVIGFISVFGGCLAAAFVKTQNGHGSLEDNLKDVLSEVFPEALIALLAIALLTVVASTLSNAFGNTTEQLASSNDKRILANAQDTITKAQNTLKSEPLNVQAHKDLEKALKTMVEHGSTQILRKNTKNGKDEMQPAINPEELRKYKTALEQATQMKKYTKLEVAAKLVQHGKGSEKRQISTTKSMKNTLTGNRSKNTETNREYLERIAKKMNITISDSNKITSNNNISATAETKLKSK